MKKCSYSYSKYMLGLLVLAGLSLILWTGNNILIRPPMVEAKMTQERAAQERAAFDKLGAEIKASVAEIRAAIDVQHRHHRDLMTIPEVVGTATGFSEAGRPVILVFARHAVRAWMIPERLEGVSVTVEVTGDIFAMRIPSRIRVDATGFFSRPVPIGVSTGNQGECSAGTIGARVKDNAGRVYALSNNHVYALENVAHIGSNVVQPGLIDTDCVYNPNNIIGTLANFEPIVFSTSASNIIDAAIALSDTALLDNKTPSTRYQIPKSATASPIINQAVQKYGRTTGLTKGRIAGINAIINVDYDSGTARFVNQIVVRSSRPFIKPGDSGSLLVTYPNRNPIGLLFAGDASGRYAFANQIDDVLTRFGVTIDGEQ